MEEADSFCFEFTYQLGHVAHRTEHAPGSWTIDNGEQNAHNQRGEYLAILLLTSEYLPFPVSLPEIQMHQPRRADTREALFQCPHLSAVCIVWHHCVA